MIDVSMKFERNIKVLLKAKQQQNVPVIDIIKSGRFPIIRTTQTRTMFAISPTRPRIDC